MNSYHDFVVGEKEDSREAVFQVIASTSDAQSFPGHAEGCLRGRERRGQGKRSKCVYLFCPLIDNNK